MNTIKNLRELFLAGVVLASGTLACRIATPFNVHIGSQPAAETAETQPAPSSAYIPTPVEAQQPYPTCQTANVADTYGMRFSKAFLDENQSHQSIKTLTSIIDSFTHETGKIAYLGIDDMANRIEVNYTNGDKYVLDSNQGVTEATIDQLLGLGSSSENTMRTYYADGADFKAALCARGTTPAQYAALLSSDPAEIARLTGIIDSAQYEVRFADQNEQPKIVFALGDEQYEVLARGVNGKTSRAMLGKWFEAAGGQYFIAGNN
jgi:hypothetical protein